MNLNITIFPTKKYPKKSLTPLSKIQESVLVTSHQSPHQLALLSHPSIRGGGKGGHTQLTYSPFYNAETPKQPQTSCKMVFYEMREVGKACTPRFKPINDSRHQIHFGGIRQLFLYMPYIAKTSSPPMRRAQETSCGEVQTTTTYVTSRAQ